MTSTKPKGRPKGSVNKKVHLTLDELTNILGKNSPIRIPVSKKWYETMTS